MTKTLNRILMKNNEKKIQLKKHLVSVLNAYEIKGGINTTTLITVTCKSFIHNGEDNCVSNQQ